MTSCLESRRPVHLLALALSSALLATSACKKGEPAAAPGAPTAAAPTAAAPKNASAVAAPGSPIVAKVTLRIGAGSGLLNPRSVAVDKSGNIYVADTGHSRIVKFDPSGREVLKFGKKGNSPGDFGEPWMVGVSGQGNLLVLDRVSQFAQVFSPDGKYLSRFGGAATGFYFPAGMAIASDGTPLVADTGNNRVVLLGEEGKPPALSIRKAGEEAFNQPPEVAVGPSGTFLVLGLGGPGNKGRLFQITPDGTLKAAWMVDGVPTTRDTPRIVVAPDGRIVMTDPEERRVVVYAPDMSTVSPVVLEGDQAAPLKVPSGIAVDPQGRFYVVDVEANLVYRLELGKGN